MCRTCVNNLAFQTPAMIRVTTPRPPTGIVGAEALIHDAVTVDVMRCHGEWAVYTCHFPAHYNHRCRVILQLNSNQSLTNKLREEQQQTGTVVIG